MINEVVTAIEAGEPVILPTDTVYGLCADAQQEDAVRRLYRLKGRDDVQPTALVAADEEAVFGALPELRGSRLLPGPYTLILRNPAHRFPWLTGERPDTIGVRLPALPDDAAEIVRRIGVVAATSANVPGGRDPRTVEEIPADIRSGCAAILDSGELPGAPSTVIDLSGSRPRIVREGAVPAAEALARLG